MNKVINKYKNYIVERYDNSKEDERFDIQSQRVEYLTTLRYIDKYLKPNSKVLEVGAGTGRYSINLAKRGHDVTAVELVKSNLNVLLKNGKNLKNLKGLQGDALGLSHFPDNSFDMVLNLGPMYHLFTNEDCIKAACESVRVCRPGGICMFAFITHSALTLEYGVRKYIESNAESFKEILDNFEDDNYTIKSLPDHTFRSHDFKQFKNYFKGLKVKPLKMLTTDSIFPIMREEIDEMTSEHYNLFLKWHYATCEKKTHWGLSSHMLYILKKQ